MSKINRENYLHCKFFFINCPKIHKIDLLYLLLNLYIFECTNQSANMRIGRLNKHVLFRAVYVLKRTFLQSKIYVRRTLAARRRKVRLFNAKKLFRRSLY